MLTLNERLAAERHIATIAVYDRNAGVATQQVWTLAQHHSDEAALIWMKQMERAVSRINDASPQTQIGIIAQQVLDGQLHLW